VYYAIKERLAHQLDPRNKRAHYFNLLVICSVATAAAFIAMPMPDTTPAPIVVKIQAVKDTRPQETFEENQARNFRLCESALEEIAVQCRIKKDNKTCNKWMKHSQIGCDHYKTTWSERNPRTPKNR
jgi:hypothetical protein